MNTYKILSILIISLLIPLSSYSLSNIQGDTLILNNKQIKAVLLDKKELDYRRKLSKQDSLHIKQLEKKVFDYQEGEKGFNLLLGIKENRINKLKFQNKVIMVTSGIIIGGITYLYITK